MAKIRVYELARELNMQNSALLEKLGAMDISVKSHMSSLDDETIVRIKKNLFSPETETVEMIRVKPTVIRRRKKRAPEEPVRASAAPEPADADQEDLPETSLKSKKAGVAKKPSKKDISKVGTAEDAEDKAKKAAGKKEPPEIKPVEDGADKVDSKTASTKDQKKSKKPSALKPATLKTAKPKKKAITTNRYKN